MSKIIETERLVLRTWLEKDAASYYQINQDRAVTEFLRGGLTREQVDDFIAVNRTKQETYGYSLWVAELKRTGEVMGFIGLNYIDWEAHFTPAVEIGWRLGSQYWGNGYATEGAQASLAYGFKQCGLKEIVAITVPKNARSIRVMEKIGLRRDPHGDFAHPKIEPNDRLSRHILYRLKAEEYFTQ